MYKCVIFDIDGVLEYQGKVYNGAIETVKDLKQMGVCVRFLTNSTLKSRNSAAMKLINKGFDVRIEEVVTASYATAQYLRKLNPHSCYVMVEREGINEFSDFVIDSMQPEYVVIGDNRSRFNFNELNKVLRMLLNGSKLIGMIPELIDSSLGEVELNVGSWVKMLENASDIKAKYIGKPNKLVFDMILESIDVKRNESVIVGDRVQSDIIGAYNAGICSILLKTGEYRKCKEEKIYKPTHTFSGIHEIMKLWKK